MDRRRFLKYAGATAAVVGASAFGLDYLLQPSPSTENPTTLMPMRRESTTTKVSSASSAQSVQLVSLHGRLFFDYNGNGIQDGEEPPVAGALVQLKDSTGTVIAETLTDSAGDYALEDAPAGRYTLRVEPDEKFRYMCTSKDEIKAVTQGYAISLNGPSKMNVGLMEGLLTLPFRKGTKFSRSSSFGMTGMFDVDRRSGFVRSYDPSHVPPASESGGMPPWVVDQHDAIDYCIPIGTDIVAAAPGIVKEINYDEKGGGNYVVIYHQFQETQNLYAHLSKILVEKGARVSRNQLIAKSGNTGHSGEPHLHFRYATWTTPPNPIDPYRDLSNPSSLSYWTVDNSPQYPD